ncbi:Pentatricopeptide repeat-containing protein [Striga hermonthica]|uniref:Pentatricopeptide repeat-containing protein n=1 Tax=Striga hermonthica TaxID=68872 RepID=A0A9N7N7F7_STRHE|nr:Pentatricopeptide repeat-containing protein [Striga hermonthica]
MPLRGYSQRALHTRSNLPRSVVSTNSLPPPPPLSPSPPDNLLVSKALSILKLYHQSQLDPLISQFTPQSASYLLLQCQNDHILTLKFVNWARKLPFFSNQLECHCISIHILTRFKLYKAAQSLAEEAALVFPDDDKGDSVFSCLRDTYQACGSSSAVFDLVIKALSNLKLIDRALNMMTLARNHGFMPSVLSYNSILEAIIRKSAPGYVEFAGNVYQGMIDHGVSPNVFTYNILIRGLCANKEIGKGLCFFNEMEKKGCLPNVVTYNTLIDAYCKTGNMDEAYALLKLMWKKKLEPNVITYNVIINGLCREGRMKETTNIFEEMKRKGLVPDEITYNTLINGYCREGNLHQALFLHAHMVRNGLSPNVVTYTSLINSMCKARNLNRAMEFFNQMQIRGLRPNEKTYTTLIDGFSQQGFMDEACRLLNEMISKGFSPSIITYNALINGHCVSGSIDDGLELIKTMTAKGVCPDVVSYSTIISGFCRKFDLDKAFRTKEDMIEKGIFPDAITYSSLIQGLCGQRRLAEACELFKEMWRIGLPPDKCTYTSLINGYCSEDDIESAIGLHNEMIKHGFFPDVVTYSVLINGMNKRAGSKEAKRLLFKLYFEQSVPHEVTYDLLIESCGNNELALMKGFCMKGLMKEADLVFQGMLKKNNEPDETVYNVLIHGHCRGGNLNRAIELYKEMVHHGLVPHAVTVIAIAKELHKVGLTDELGQILRETLRNCKVIDGDRAKDLIEILERFNMKSAKPVNTPLASHFKLSKQSCPTSQEEKEAMAGVPYSSAVGSLMYAMVCTRPDIAHAVGIVSRYLSNPGKDHWEDVKWILRRGKTKNGNFIWPELQWVPFAWPHANRYNCKLAFNVNLSPSPPPSLVLPNTFAPVTSHFS